ncbi:MAG: PssD/Cps14F family polysaccharide biosynthesis glycosyltransferase [Candidatus Aenigmatarchaeota archaeon]
MKICIACSAGGHLVEASRFLPIIKKYEYFFVTFRKKQSEDLLKSEKKYFIINPKRNLFKLFINFLQSLRIWMKEKPKIIISTGAGAALPMCLVGKFFGSKIIFVETLAAVFKPSLSGRLIYPISDLFIVQWKQNLKFYKKAIYGGNLI